MFSAFSFGKIIKTILPGSILAGGLVLLVEALWSWKIAPGESPLALLAGKEWLTALTAALVPASLILGFLLNTWVWSVCNQRIRSEVETELGNTAFPEIRRKLSAELRQEISTYLTEPNAAAKTYGFPTRVSLEYFYLPVISLQRLNYLWESYFSWYEFQVNTAFAILVSTLPAIFLLWVMTYPNRADLFYAGTALLVGLALVLFWGLWRTARANLVEYERDLMLLIAGSLSLATKTGSGETRPG